MVFDSIIILNFARLVSKFKDDGITKPEEQEISYETQLSQTKSVFAKKRLFFHFHQESD
jgi:hypothetical protein